MTGMTGLTGPGPTSQPPPPHAPSHAVDAAPAPARLEFLDRVARLPILSLFFNAIFQKEMRVAGRKQATYLIRAVYAGLMLGVIVIFLLSLVTSGGRGSAYETEQLQRLAPFLSVALVWFTAAMLVFLAPAMTVPAFMDERRRRTLPALMTTPLSSTQIVAAKLLSQVTQLAILALLCLPVLLAVRVFGGVPAAFLLKSMTIILSAAILVATVSLRFSLYRRRADVAIIAAFIAVAVIQAAPILLPWILHLVFGGNPIIFLIPTTGSPFALMMLTFELLEGRGMPFPSWTWAANVLYNLVWTAIFAVSTTIALRRVLLLEGAGVEYLRARKKRRGRTHAGDERLPERDRRVASVPDITSELTPDPASEDRDNREVGDRPILWRELRQPAFRSRGRMLLYSGCIAAFLLLIYAAVGVDEVDMRFVIAIIATLLILLRAAAGSTASFTAERDARTWETLLTTPLTAREIVWGKFAGTLRSQWFVPAVLLAHLVAMIAARQLHPVVILHVAMIVGACSIFLSATGVFFGLVVRRSTPAAILNIAVGLVLWAGIPMAGVLLIELFNFHMSWLKETGEVVVPLLNPVYHVVTAIDGADASKSMLRYDSLTSGQIGVVQYTLQVAAVSAGYLLSAAGVLFAACKLFPAASDRSS